MKFQVICSLSIFLISNLCLGGSLKDQKWISYENGVFESDIEVTNTKCGTKLKAAIDWDSFSKNKAATEGSSVGAYCAHGLGGLRLACEDALAKTEISKKIKSLKCQFGGKGKRAAKVSGDTFSISVDFDAPNNEDYFKEQLENLL